MATPPVVSFQFPAGGSAHAPYVGQNFADLIKYISDRNDGTVDWDVLSVAGASTFKTAITITPTSNQIVLGTTRTVTLHAPTPASASRIVTIPDLSGAYSVVGTIGTQTISGTKTFDGQLIGKGTATNDNAATGYIGETVVSVQSSFQNAGASSQWFNVTSVSLTAGDWLAFGTVGTNHNGATITAGSIACAVSIHSGNTTTDHVLPDNVSDIFDSPTAAQDSAGFVDGYRLSLSGTTTVYLKALIGFTAGTPRARGRIRCVRIR